MFKTIPLVLLFSGMLYADIAQGKQTFDESNCLKCHSVDTFKYRKDKVSNFEKLHKVVNNCAINSGAGLFDDEIENVSLYLNDKYYHFDVKK